MIGKSNWFQRRKYTGWGLSPKTWQGWVYVICFVLPLIALQYIENLSFKTKIILTGIWILILLIDVVDIMRKIKLDEREKRHEAISERNALWGIMFVLIIGVFYDLIKSSQEIQINPFILAAIIAGVLIKGITNFILDKTD